MLFIDRTPLTLGIETIGGVMTKIIPRGTLIPARRSQAFTTYQDIQEIVSIQVSEGERSMIKNNHLLSKFDLTGIQKAPRGTSQIEVTFEIDFNNIFELTAVNKESKSNKSQKIGIKNDSSMLFQEEIEQTLKSS